MGGHGGGMGGHEGGMGGHMEMYIKAFWETEEGQLVASYKQMYVDGTLSDEDFEDWKSILLSKCPWYKQQEAAYQAGEIDEGFPFIGMLKSGTGKVWDGDYDTPSEYPLDMSKMSWGNKDKEGGHHGHHGHHGHGEDHDEKIKEHNDKVQKLIDTCPKAAEQCGISLDQDKDYKKGGGLDWDAVMKDHLSMFECLMGVDRASVSDECADMLDRYDDMHSRMQEKMEKGGYHKDHSDHMKKFIESTEGQWMAAMKEDYVNGDITEEDIEFKYWKEQLMAKCPWYQMQQRKADRGEIEGEFPFFDQLTSGEGPAWEGFDKKDKSQQRPEDHKEMMKIMHEMYDGKMHGGKMYGEKKMKMKNKKKHGKKHAKKTMKKMKKKDNIKKKMNAARLARKKKPAITEQP